MAASLKSTVGWPSIINPAGLAAAATSGSRTNTSLDSAYVHGTSGDGMAIRYVCPTTDTIDELYVFLDTITGTRGNITMEAKIYNEHASSATQPGSTERDVSTATSMPDADDKWIKFTFGTPYTPAVGEILWLVFYNTAGAPTTDFPQILTGTNLFFENFRFGAYTTTGGFSAAGTAAFEVPFVVKQGSNYFGQPFTNLVTTNYANNQLKRGIVVTAAASVSLYGIEFSAVNAYTAVEIFTSAQNPGDTPAHSFNLGSIANQTLDEVIGGKTFATTPSLTQGEDYKIVLTYGANSQGPSVAKIEDYASYSGVFDAMTDGWNFCHSCQDNGSGGWTIDKSTSPAIRVSLAGFTEESNSVVVGGGMNGGMNG